MLVVGPAVQDVEAEFDQYWNSEYSYPAATLIRSGTAEELDQLRARKETKREEQASSTYIEALHNSPLAHACWFHWSTSG